MFKLNTNLTQNRASQGLPPQLLAMLQQLMGRYNIPQQPAMRPPLGGSAPQMPMGQRQAMQQASMGTPQMVPPGGPPQGYGQSASALLSSLSGAPQMPMGQRQAMQQASMGTPQMVPPGTMPPPGFYQQQNAAMDAAMADMQRQQAPMGRPIGVPNPFGAPLAGGPQAPAMQPQGARQRFLQNPYTVA